jgi:phosphonate ABC transporter permease subunit PhnE
MGLVGLIGTGAALLGLLVPLIAAMIGAQILPQLYNHLTHQVEHRGGPTPRTTQTIRSVLALVGGLATFAFVLLELNVMRAIVLGVLPTDALVNVGGIAIEAFVFKAIVIGAVLGGALGAIVGTRTTFPMGSVLYNITRTILNTLRSVEPLIMGLVFVIWVGLGPFAGVLALTLHSIASLGKLYSEQVESIDNGPMEALESTGANRLQTIVYGAVPQIIPPYIAFTLYRWDINVRMSTIIGFVGGGGIGFLLQQQINLLQYRSAGVAVLAIAVVVSVLDYASAAIRERYI